MSSGYWIFFLALAALMVPLALARYLAASKQRHLDDLRRVDPHMASGIEQVHYSLNPASLPLRDRSFEKPRHPNHF
jgi:hypothetical protein